MHGKGGDMCGEGGMHGEGRACVVGAYVAGGMGGRGGMHGRKDGHCSRQYASYWNEFLCSTIMGGDGDLRMVFCYSASVVGVVITLIGGGDTQTLPAVIEFV